MTAWIRVDTTQSGVARMCRGKLEVHVHVDNHCHGVTAAEIESIVAAQLTAALTPLEGKMSEIGTYLDSTGNTLGQVIAKLNDVSADIGALLAKAADRGVFNTEERAKADSITSQLQTVAAALGTLDTEVGDQDNSDVPVVEPSPADTGDGGTPAPVEPGL